MKTLKDPMVILSNVAKSNHGETPKTIRAAARVEFNIAPDTYAEAFFNDWFDRNFARVAVRVDRRSGSVVAVVSKAPAATAAPRTAPQRATPEERKRREEERDAAVQRFYREGVLNMKLGNGKRVFECTGRELRTFGGWLFDIAKGLRDNEVLGNRMSHEEAQRVFERHHANKSKVA
ncbi:hypothetical protein [Bradyrhizobium sp. 153]|uniref:hypothetical protein n=1 Tax=Bradyrhizobium sp. 153 TaxID=2782627 RepID=UPI001FF76E70|nr:hypothetical protein [Bradyrhizobium sp. 153]MCK1668678.1 hypothetical protein [Bradyrhizobium sp. 153]